MFLSPLPPRCCSRGAGGSLRGGSAWLPLTLCGWLCPLLPHPPRAVPRLRQPQRPAGHQAPPTGFGTRWERTGCEGSARSRGLESPTRPGSTQPAVSRLIGQTHREGAAGRGRCACSECIYHRFIIPPGPTLWHLCVCFCEMNKWVENARAPEVCVGRSRVRCLLEPHLGSPACRGRSPVCDPRGSFQSQL